MVGPSSSVLCEEKTKEYYWIGKKKSRLRGTAPITSCIGRVRMQAACGSRHHRPFNKYNESTNVRRPAPQEIEDELYATIHYV